jgi:hypothetical protein
MNVANFIFRLLYITNLLSLDVLSDPPRSPCTPFVDCAHLSTDYVNSCSDYDNTFVDYINFSINYDNKYDDCVNTLNDWVNTIIDSADIPNISSLNLYIPNPSFLQLLIIDLLLIYRSKITIVLTVGSSICYSSSVFCISPFSSSSFVSKFSI